MKTALVLACDDNFIPYTSVVARRIAHYVTEKFPVIVVSDGVSDENKRLAQKFCPEISFVEAAPLFEDRLLPVGGSISRASYLRLFLDEILTGLDRVVYLDSDVSPLVDVSPLLAMTPRAAPVIATHDLHTAVDMSYLDRLRMSGPYFNGGVAVFDLKTIRTEGIFRQALQYALDYPERCAMHDQDALNAVLNGRWQTLDWRWNAMNYMSDLIPSPPFIRHFAGSKPWTPKKKGIERRFIGEWRTDLSESPWPDRFQPEAAKYRVERVLAPLGSMVERFAKSLTHGKRADRRGNNVRLAKNFPAVLAHVGRSAQAGAIAEMLPLG